MNTRSLPTRIAILVAALAVAAALYWTWSTLRHPDPEALRREFTAGIPHIFRTPGGNLELVAFTTTEILSRSSARTLPWFNWEVPYSRSITEIRVPVTYRYYIRLQDPWDIAIRDGTCIVRAPALRAELPPAIHTDGMKTYARGELLALDREGELTRLLESLTPALSRYADSRDHKELIRDRARETVAEFIRAWLLERDTNVAIDTIRVVFADEMRPPDRPAGARPPTDP